MGRAVVRGEHDDRVLLQPVLLQFLQYVADIPIHARDHGRISGARREMRGIAVAAAARERRIVPLQLQAGLQLLVRNVQRDVRNDRRVIQEKRPILVVADEPDRLLIDPVRRIILPLEFIVTPRILGIRALGQRAVPRNRRVVVQLHLLVVAPQRLRVIAVRMCLAIVAEEAVKSLLHRIAGGAGVAQPPLAEGPGRIALLLQQLGDRHRFGGDWMLPLRLAESLHRAIVAHLGMARVLTGHQYTARGRADSIARVGVGEAKPLLRQ